jgi:hypothetical protein
MSARGICVCGGRREEEIRRKRDLMILKMIEPLEGIGAFEPA